MIFIINRGAPTIPPKYLEYIQSDGTQYILTDILPNGEQTVKIDMESMVSSGNSALFGARTEQGGTSFCIFQIEQNSRFDYNTTQYPISSPSIANSRFTMEFGNGTIKINGSAKEIIPIKDISTISVPMAIFQINMNAGTYQTGMAAKLYSLTVSNGQGEIEYSFKPAIDPNGIVCLYEEKNNKYYYNSGVGDFVAGPEL